MGRLNSALTKPRGSDAALAQAVFAYQFEVKQARDAAAKSGAPASEAPPAADAKTQTRNLSLNAIAMDIAGKEAAMKAPESGNANAAMAATDAMQPNAMQPNAAKPPAQPLNIIQKTYRSEALARLQRRLSREEGEDLILMCYMSRDFREGLDAFLNKRQPQWAGE